MPTALSIGRLVRAGLAPRLLSSAVILSLAGCAAMPVAGPMSPQIAKEADSEAPPFLLVQVDRITLTALSHVAAEGVMPLATPEPPPVVTIRVGDTVSVTLWEFGSGLLGPLGVSSSVALGLVGAQSATVPVQTVDQSGTILVPFAGEIPAAGQTTRQVQRAIVAALRGKANQTQALVQVVQSTDNAVTVSGDANRPGRVPLNRTGTRLLDAISQAGGTTGKARDMLVQLTRGGVVRSVRLVDLQDNPPQNIFLVPGDLVTLAQEPQTLVVLGATKRNQEVVFTKSRVTLAEALGNGGGLSDQIADPFGVYVLRYEPVDVAKSLRTSSLPDYLTAGAQVPVVYQINLKSADGLLLAQSFSMRDRDVVFVATSQTTQLSKLTQLFNNIVSIGNSQTTQRFTD
ncbi:polysaccharide biosynthesis/export family protein [Novosphingobium sp. Chol11]|uniref:polysaccharide biosynthesis/export family protein n=1 Tax=Novosphingobium sp. Chol11 TaxID=1385763 RepID=UPI0025FFECBE|nr:polysaccharide biosynthesis/export family protein [Novosphingobium sp. Chol11]